MNTNEIFENRRAVAIKICQSIRKNGRQLLNAQFFLERPYCADSHSYKFSSANFLRLLAADNDAICKCNPRWFSADELKIMVGLYANMLNLNCLKYGLGVVGKLKVNNRSSK